MKNIRINPPQDYLRKRDAHIKMMYFSIRKLIDKYPNDKDLGAAIRKQEEKFKQYD